MTSNKTPKTVRELHEEMAAGMLVAAARYEQEAAKGLSRAAQMAANLRRRAAELTA